MEIQKGRRQAQAGFRGLQYTEETAMGLVPGTLSQNSFSFSLTRCDPTQASGSLGSQVEQLLTL